MEWKAAEQIYDDEKLSFSLFSLYSLLLKYFLNVLPHAQAQPGCTEAEMPRLMFI